VTEGVGLLAVGIFFFFFALIIFLLTTLLGTQRQQRSNITNENCSKDWMNAEQGTDQGRDTAEGRWAPMKNGPRDVDDVSWAVGECFFHFLKKKKS
jgi:hypothetical protein